MIHGCTSAFSELKVELSKAADFSDEGDQDDDVFYLDLSGLFAWNSQLQCEIHGFSDRDLRKLFERLRSFLVTMFIGADKGVAAAAAYAALQHPRRI